MHQHVQHFLGYRNRIGMFTLKIIFVPMNLQIRVVFIIIFGRWSGSLAVPERKWPDNPPRTQTVEVRFRHVCQFRPAKGGARTTSKLSSTISLERTMPCTMIPSSFLLCGRQAARLLIILSAFVLSGRSRRQGSASASSPKTWVNGWRWLHW